MSLFTDAVMPHGWRARTIFIHELWITAKERDVELATSKESLSVDK